MTRQRNFGSDVEFMAWLRANPFLRSVSEETAFVATDVDFIGHCYKIKVRDKIGTRQIQGIMFVEVKTRGGNIASSQLDTLYKLNLFKGQRKTFEGTIIFHGVFFLLLDGTTPSNSKDMKWGIFPKEGSTLIWKKINPKQLEQLLRFEINPQNLSHNAYRRHHKTSEVVIEELTELGFPCQKRIIHRS